MIRPLPFNARLKSLVKFILCLCQSFTSNLLIQLLVTPRPRIDVKNTHLSPPTTVAAQLLVRGR